MGCAADLQRDSPKKWRWPHSLSGYTLWNVVFNTFVKHLWKMTGSLSLSHRHAFSHTHTHRHAWMHACMCTHTHTHTHTHSLSLSLSHTHTHSLSLTHTLSLSHTHMHSHTHTHIYSTPLPTPHGYPSFFRSDSLAVNPQVLMSGSVSSTSPAMNCTARLGSWTCVTSI